LVIIIGQRQYPTSRMEVLEEDDEEGEEGEEGEEDGGVRLYS